MINIGLISLVGRSAHHLFSSEAYLGIIFEIFLESHIIYFESERNNRSDTCHHSSGLIPLSDLPRYAP